MDRKGHSFDREIANLAARQHGVVALWQLLALGLSREAVRNRVDLGRLHRLYPGVYAVGHRKISWQGRIMAAVLLHGREAVASHRTAAALWDLLPPRGNDVYVTVPAAGRARRNGIVLHQVRELHPKDRAIKQGIPVTALGRTLIDVFSTESEERTERALEQAERMGLLDGNAIDQACERAPTRRGVKRIRTRVRQHRAPARTRSALERRFLLFCRKHNLPAPEMNAWVEDYELDAVWREQKVVVELDDYHTHRTRKSFENDRRRDARLQSLGYRVIRITAERLKAEPGVVAEELRRLLSLQ
jgi:very-short-patch-repair endonuclease